MVDDDISALVSGWVTTVRGSGSSSAINNRLAEMIARAGLAWRRRSEYVESAVLRYEGGGDVRKASSIAVAFA